MTDFVIEPFSRLCEDCDAEYLGPIPAVEDQYQVDIDGWLMILHRMTLCPVCSWKEQADD